MALKHLTALAAQQESIALEETSIAMEGVKETLVGARDKLIGWVKVFAHTPTVGEAAQATIDSAAYMASAMTSLKAKISASAPEHIEIKGITRVLRRLGLVGQTAPDLVREIKARQKIFQSDVRLAHASFKRVQLSDGIALQEYKQGIESLKNAQAHLKPSNPGLSVAMKITADKNGLLSIVQALIEFMNAVQGTLKQYDFSKFDFSAKKAKKENVAQEEIAMEGVINAMDGTDGAIIEFLHTVLVTGMVVFSLFLLFSNPILGIAAFWGTSVINRFINWLLYGGAGSHEREEDYA